MSIASIKAERKLAITAAVVCAIGFGIILKAAFFPAAQERSRRELVAMFLTRKSDSLIKAVRHLEQFPGDPLVTAIAGEFCIRDSNWKRANHYFTALPKDGSFWEFYSNVGLARSYMVPLKLVEMEAHLRRALELSPYDLVACERLGDLLQNEGRTWEGSPYFMRQILRGKCRGDELIAVACAECFYRADDRFKQLGLRDNYPESPMLVARARGLIASAQTDEADSTLKNLLAKRPDFGEAQGRLGRLIVDRNDYEEFLRWRGSLPDTARNHPEVWFVQGLQARRMKMEEGAAYCFSQALKLSSNHIASSLQLAQSLEKLGFQNEARVIAEHGKWLGQLDTNLNIFRTTQSIKSIRTAIPLVISMGRYWEAAGWNKLLAHVLESNSDPEAHAALREMNRYVTLARQHPNSHDILARLQLPSFPPPNWPPPKGTGNEARKNSSAKGDFEGWKFQDVAATTGINFTYYEGTTEETRLQHIFNTMGGGVGVIDLDLDGWPDLHLPQANNWRNPAPQPTYSDRTFRNRDGEHFDDATQLTGTGDTGFTHGVAVGDFDTDGFPDFYLGNLGANRLFHNNGDGTFTDTTSIAGVAGNEWSTSSVWADLTNDGLPDLYVMSYSLMNETRDKECHEGKRPVSCGPDALTPEIGRLFVNRGDGTFADVTARLNPPLAPGLGLGIVAWNYSQNGRIELFLANDTMANMLLIHHGNDSAGIPILKDEAVVRGVALDPDGHAQASMGVAAGDADGDGQLDLYITTFYGESKTLYSLRKDGFFDYSTRAMSLREAGFWMVGFGSQFADLNNDGWQDLVVTNGHVDLRTSRNEGDRMRPQVLVNRNGKRFDDVPHERLGEFFDGMYLGRGLATLDWNGDGMLDFGISHLHSPFALITNHCESLGKTISLRLIGKNHTRPIGATVTMNAGGRSQTRFVTGGDGFLVSNENLLRFAVPSTENEVRFRVVWLNGREDSWIQPVSNSNVTFIEGDPRSPWSVLR